MTPSNPALTSDAILAAIPFALDAERGAASEWQIARLILGTGCRNDPNAVTHMDACDVLLACDAMVRAGVLVMTERSWASFYAVA